MQRAPQQAGKGPSRPPGRARISFGTPRGRHPVHLCCGWRIARASVVSQGMTMLADAATRPRFAIAREWLLPSRTMRRPILPPAIGLVYIAGAGLLARLPPDPLFVGPPRYPD